MKRINPNKVGLALAALYGTWHLFWSLLVAVGCAQWILNFVFWLHFLNSPFTVAPFHLATALLLILVTAIIGYTLGYLFGLLWNWLHRAAPILQ
jgi:hypothetical protein